MISIGVRGVKAAMEPRHRSLTTRGLHGCRKSSRNWSNSLTLADEFSRANRRKKSIATGCIWSSLGQFADMLLFMIVLCRFRAQNFLVLVTEDSGKHQLPKHDLRYS